MSLFYASALVLSVAFAQGADRSRLAALKAWNQYVNTTIVSAPHGLQEDCVPQRFAAESTFRGTALLFHGYSACPQQYFQIAPLLARQGFDVLLPLNPGHGNRFDAVVNHGHCLYNCDGALDDTTNLPESAKGYSDFVEQMNSIMTMSPGKRVVAGLSVGGAMAVLAGQARDGDHPLYDRQLIINPLLHLVPHVDPLLRGLNVIPGVRNLFLGWGAGCRNEREHGRAGICTFKVKHGAAARDFGANLVRSQGLSAASVAVLYDHRDPVVDTAPIRELITSFRSNARGQQHCVMNFTMHSMLSQWDDYGEEKWWMNELYCKIVAFLCEGVSFPMAQQRDVAESNEQFCHLECSSNSCHYHRNQKLACPFHPPSTVVV